jgi:hypothetical protein
MATISTPNTSFAILFLPSSNHWRLMGLEITTSYVSTVYTVYNLVSAGLLADDNTPVSTMSQFPSYLIFDRIYIHGLPTANTNRGIQMDAVSIAVVDSYCDEIHSNGQDSQCLASWNGPGPFLIQNNFVQAGAEDILFGGADPAITNLVPSDITIVGNLIQKNTAWRGEAAPYSWVIKNLVELKNAQRVLLDGNVMQYIWNAEQVGDAILSTPRNQNGTCTWCVVQDVTATHNLIQHACMGTEIAAQDTPTGGLGYSLPSARELFQNNVYNDVSNTNWCGGTGGGWVFEIAMSSGLNAHDLIFDHNTTFTDNTFLYLAGIAGNGTTANVAVTNNLSAYGVYGIGGTGTDPGTPTLSTYLSPYTWNDIAFINSTGTTDGNAWPSGTFWSTQVGVQFTNFSSGNYQLLSGSPYHDAGTDGRDIGVWDWTCLNNDSAAALTGKFVPSAGCALSVSLQPQPPTNLIVVVQ